GGDMWAGRIQTADGTYHDVMFHALPNHDDGTSLPSIRLRKEMAAYHLNQMLGFDNGFPATPPRDIVFRDEHMKCWIPVASCKTFEARIRELARERLGIQDRVASGDVALLVKEDPQLHRQVEQAFVERLIYGDCDDHSQNFVIVETPGGPRVQSIDLDYAFTGAHQPTWDTGRPHQGVNSRLHADFSEQALSPDTLGKIQVFVRTYNTPEGRQQLAGLGLTCNQVDGLLARAQWLADKGKFPKAVNFAQEMRARSDAHRKESHD